MATFITKDSALIIVDIQNDFCPGGALAVPDGDKVIHALNKYIAEFLNAGAPIFATQDWHPHNHGSFKIHGGQWPSHCIQGTDGAKFHRDLNLPASAELIRKGTAVNAEGYSGFDGTNLERGLNKRGIERLFIGGLATDYCVRHTALDGLKKGFEVILLEDAIQGVNVNSEDSEKSIEEMVKAGARKITLLDINPL